MSRVGLRAANHVSHLASRRVIRREAPARSGLHENPATCTRVKGLGWADVADVRQISFGKGEQVTLRYVITRTNVTLRSRNQSIRKRGGPTARSALRLVLAQCRCPRVVGRRVLSFGMWLAYFHFNQYVPRNRQQPLWRGPI